MTIQRYDLSELHYSLVFEENPEGKYVKYSDHVDALTAIGHQFNNLDSEHLRACGRLETAEKDRAAHKAKCVELALALKASEDRRIAAESERDDHKREIDEMRSALPELPPEGSPLRDLGARLSELLDEDHWANAERQILAVQAQVAALTAERDEAKAAHYHLTESYNGALKGAQEQLARATLAEAALERSGFTRCPGPLAWKPPMNEAAGENWRKLIAAEARATAAEERAKKLEVSLRDQLGHFEAMAKIGHSHSQRIESIKAALAPSTDGAVQGGEVGP